MSEQGTIPAFSLISQLCEVAREGALPGISGIPGVSNLGSPKGFSRTSDYSVRICKNVESGFPSPATTLRNLRNP